MRALLLALLLLLPLPAIAADPVTIDIRWEYRDFPAKVELFEIDGRQRLWETKSVTSLAEAPVAAAFSTDTFAVRPGQTRRFTLVVRNETSEPLYFFAAPHVIEPPEYSLGFKFKCLCINHAYAVGPGEVWYRVVEFRLARDFVGDRLTVTHSIIGIDAERAKAFDLNRKQSDL